MFGVWVQSNTKLCLLMPLTNIWRSWSRAHQLCVFLQEEWMDCEESTHFKKRQSLAGKKRTKIEHTM